MKKSSHTFVVLAYKESPFLEECLKSVLNQSMKTSVIIATTTPSKYISSLAKKYHLDIVNGPHTSIGGDFDFALNASDSHLVTIAHQDDIYDYYYAERIVKASNKYPHASILFTDYYELRKGKKVLRNINLIIKRVLLLPLRLKFLSGTTFAKRFVLRFGSAICCPSVTFNRENTPKQVFQCDLKCNIDWFAWEKLSKLKGNFIYLSQKLMGHRIDESTTTTDVIKQGIRREEDLVMFKKFWPNWMAKTINHFYSNSEKSNEIKEAK